MVTPVGPYWPGSLDLLVHTEHPFGKDALRDNGVQWSDEVVTTEQDWKTIESITIEPPGPGGSIIEVELGITWAQKSSGATKYVRGRVQARNKDGTWVDLIDDAVSPAAGNAYKEDAADASAYHEHTFSGRFATVANFNAVPLDVQVQVYPEAHATETVKNSSYVKVIYDSS